MEISKEEKKILPFFSFYLHLDLEKKGHQHQQAGTEHSTQHCNYFLEKSNRKRCTCKIWEKKNVGECTVTAEDLINKIITWFVCKQWHKYWKKNGKTKVKCCMSEFSVEDKS